MIKNNQLICNSGCCRQVFCSFWIRFGWPVLDTWSLFRGWFSTRIAWAGFRVVFVDRWLLAQIWLFFVIWIPFNLHLISSHLNKKKTGKGQSCPVSVGDAHDCDWSWLYFQSRTTSNDNRDSNLVMNWPVTASHEYRDADPYYQYTDKIKRMYQETKY